MWSEDDVRFMREALTLARSAEGITSPDPMVGAVIVKEGKIISVGYHGEFASPHAETWAIQKAEQDVRGATLYLNLEPCSHYGNNPPCVNTIIKSEIKEVVCSMKDPNPLVNGKGFNTLVKHGVKVRVGLLEKEARRLNEVFVKYITTKLPFVVLKTALTLDGKIATRTGASRWVAGEESLRFAHRLRNLYDSILVGVNTILIDNPRLTVRRVKKVKNPVRVVLDSFARTPLSANVLSSEAKTIIAVGPRATRKKCAALREKGAEIIELPAKAGMIDVKRLLKKLGEMNLTSLLLEGGGEVNASFLSAGMVDKGFFFIAPKIFGGAEAKTPVEGKGVAKPSAAIRLKDVFHQMVGEDLLIEGYF
jgi:diaminohydroxyphosphoribosylaminopyrimidine deaminase/5-amino-6-(5-phosphoribosylamino)uracil reductase